MKKAILLTTIVSTVLGTNALLAKENQNLVISGKIDSRLMVKTKVVYTAGKKALGCGSYHFDFTSMGFEWSPDSKAEIFPATVDADGNYSLTTILKNKPFDFCKWDISSFYLIIASPKSTDKDYNRYYVYTSLDYTSSNNRNLSDITLYECKLDDRYNDVDVTCKNNLENEYHSADFNSTLNFMNVGGDASINMDISVSN